MSDQDISAKQLSRRDLGKIAIAGALGATQLGWLPSIAAQEQSNPASARAQYKGIGLRCTAPADPTDDDLLFFKQVGLDYVTAAVAGLNESDAKGPEYTTAEGLRKVKKRYADAGINCNRMDMEIASREQWMDIVLNRPGRDKSIEDCKALIHTVADGGFDYFEQMFNITGYILNGDTEVRGSKARDTDLNSSQLGSAFGSTAWAKGTRASMNTPLFGRVYSKDEILANYTYFIHQIVPVLEQRGVRIGFHPDDPPTPSMFGVAHIFSSLDDYKKALKIANSPNVGICLCCGTWEEGGTAVGVDSAGAIQYFGSRKQIFDIHFRNVSSPMPHFHETYPDDGYYDQYKIMKALVDVKYDGPINLDHGVLMVGGGGNSKIRPGMRTYEAFALGYMRALLQRAQRAAAALAA